MGIYIIMYKFTYLPFVHQNLVEKSCYYLQISEFLVYSKFVTCSNDVMVVKKVCAFFVPAGYILQLHNEKM